MTLGESAIGLGTRRSTRQSTPVAPEHNASTSKGVASSEASGMSTSCSMTLPEAKSLLSASLPPAEHAFAKKGFCVLTVFGLTAAVGHEHQ